MRVAANVGEYVGLDGGWASEILGVAVPLVIVTVVVMLLYRFVPARRLRFRDAVAGGVVTGLLLLAISAASAFVYNQVAELSVIYGSITAVLVFLYSVYLYASAILFGAALAGVWSMPSATGPSVRSASRCARGRRALRTPVAAAPAALGPSPLDSRRSENRRRSTGRPGRR